MKAKTRDNLIYLGVAGAVVAAFTLYGIYAVKTTGTVPDIPGSILWGILSTPGIVALILERFWKQRRRRLLWVILISVASINVSAVFAVYSWHWNPPIVVWSTGTGLSVVLVFVVADKLLAWNRSDRKSPR
jgi:peptidoglycan/LPS O-acetylase OafA/YrhL